MNGMKIKVTVLSLIAFGIFQVNAQNGGPEKPQFEKKVYIGDEGRIFIQKSLPVYMKFSTSKDNGAKNYLLKSKLHANYTNPMYFDTEGINFIRHRWAVDQESKRTVHPKVTVKFEVYADGLPPYTSARFTGANYYTSPQGTVYYGKGLKVNLNARDGVSGVEKIHYALGGSFSDYNNPKSVDDEGAHKLHYFAHDFVGNAEKTRTRKFTVDLTPPKTSKTITGVYYKENILSPKAKFKFSSQDNLSGVRYTYYRIDDQSQKIYNSSYPVSVHYLKDGNHTLTFYSDDNVKNAENKETFKFYVDKIPPEVTVNIEGDKHIAKYKFISPRTKIKMTATDNKAGVKNITYNINSTGNKNYNNPFKMPNDRGTQRVVYYGTDNVENRSTAKSVHVYMDNRPPTTGISYGSPKFFTRDTLFINQSTNIYLSSKDYESGVQKTTYQVDEGNEKAYSNAFHISDEGFHTLTFWANDNVNNDEKNKTSEVFVDNTPPQIFSNFSIKPIGSKKKKGEVMNVYPNYTRLYIGATDHRCGTDQIEYSMDGGKTFHDYSSPYTLDVSELNRFKRKKFYSVIVRAKDKLGNQSETTVEFFVGLE